MMARLLGIARQGFYRWKAARARPRRVPCHRSISPNPPMGVAWFEVSCLWVW